MYIRPKTSFIYIPKYTDTSSWERALELSRDSVRKLDKALDLAAAARDHCSALVDIKDNAIKLIANDFNLTEAQIIDYQKKGLNLLPDDIKKDLNPNSKTMKLLVD